MFIIALRENWIWIRLHHNDCVPCRSTQRECADIVELLTAGGADLSLKDDSIHNALSNGRDIAWHSP
jgi:hypothetical protein